ncbi:unnamed protein product [Rhizoctonia solani]|uniref:Uncharacterized protein n=1 Tax=Rhizoctonia solani TaxID=456999 RepID=A0A8H2WDJ2_9AGAM|nr:unnamed protein product [Rhizoctonia solani]
MSSSLSPMDGPTGTQATNNNSLRKFEPVPPHREDKATTNSGRSTLKSLHGVDLRPKPQCYVLTNGYPKNDLTLKLESIAEDSNGLRFRMLQFDPEPDFWQYNDTHKGGSRPANYARIWKTLGVIRHGPTFIYISGHSQETSRGELAYVPADHLTTDPKLFPYETMRQLLLLKSPSSLPLLFVTEACYCDNFLRLPYVLVFKDNEVRWQKTGYPALGEGSSAVVVHCAATSPGEQAVSFENGAVFTKAFYNIDPRDELSLMDIAKRLQENVNKVLAADTTNVRTQSPKVYCSQIMNDPHFFKAMGFYCPLDSDSSAEGDSDSNISIGGQD